MCDYLKYSPIDNLDALKDNKMYIFGEWTPRSSISPEQFQMWKEDLIDAINGYVLRIELRWPLQKVYFHPNWTQIGKKNHYRPILPIIEKIIYFNYYIQYHFLWLYKTILYLSYSFYKLHSHNDLNLILITKS